ncbi:hypothetical protein K504DRAFT_220585 [Pleomassaria siparia CBS 279.74]|uniref:Uncharacterized protein n=1 Tax=Pleomassaria siparia CBS 279.74 TaxID=1314801 RepID=A0A6G1KGJ3_9PLEO|nr:hypothetical protein K504DRAFT_220585 [Pleomassaria siparia CBS 279.74]
MAVRGIVEEAGPSSAMSATPVQMASDPSLYNRKKNRGSEGKRWQEFSKRSLTRRQEWLGKQQKRYGRIVNEENVKGGQVSLGGRGESDGKKEMGKPPPLPSRKKVTSTHTTTNTGAVTATAAASNKPTTTATTSKSSNLVLQFLDKLNFPKFQSLPGSRVSVPMSSEDSGTDNPSNSNRERKNRGKEPASTNKARHMSLPADFSLEPQNKHGSSTRPVLVGEGTGYEKMVTVPSTSSRAMEKWTQRNMSLAYRPTRPEPEPEPEPKPRARSHPPTTAAPSPRDLAAGGSEDELEKKRRGRGRGRREEEKEAKNTDLAEENLNVTYVVAT